jgi:23S rRNA pseudouridine2605 synthase
MRPPQPAKSADDPQRIAKMLARAGIASRREIERMIADGRVALNGTIVDTPATILASLDGVTVDGNPVEKPAPARLFLYHKPAGLLVTERDPKGRPTIYDRLPKTLPRVMPVGRLDLATEGLLLLTTDGELKRQLELPATGVERAYRARCYGQVTQGQLEDLIHGVEIEGVRYGSIDANMERRTGANMWIELILTEGKNREVRRVLEYLGLQVSRLIRTRYGPFVLGDLPPGAVGEVRGHDVASFRKNPTRKDLPQPARQRAAAPIMHSDRAERPARTPDRAPRPPREQVGALAARPARETPRRITRAEAERTDRAAFADARPPRSSRSEVVLAKPIKPHRAARAAAFRAASERNGTAPPKPTGTARPDRGPANGRGKPRAGKPRPSRTRK